MQINIVYTTNLFYRQTESSNLKVVGGRLQCVAPQTEKNADQKEARKRFY